VKFHFFLFKLIRHFWLYSIVSKGYSYTGAIAPGIALGDPAY